MVQYDLESWFWSQVTRLHCLILEPQTKYTKSSFGERIDYQNRSLFFRPFRETETNGNNAFKLGAN